MSQAQSQRPAPQEVYRVVYLHAGKNKGTRDLKQDSYHITLFRQALNLRFANGYDAEPAGNDVSSVETIESLPRGQILGIMMITESFWFEKAKHRHSDEWMLGPFVYKIGETVKLEQGIAVDGKLGKWTPSKEIHAQIMQQPTVQQKLQEWNQRYGSKLYFGEEGIPCAMTIHQPFVEAILRGVKKYENRKRPMFPLHPKIKPSPPSPDMTQCRFCPEEDDQQMMINTDNGTQYHSPKKPKCTYWAHVKDDKRDRNGSNDRKIRKHKASKSRRASAASSLSSSQSQLSQASNHEANGNPVHGQNAVVDLREIDVFEYGIMYNTRSKAKGTEQDNIPIALMQNETIPPRRKRKHSDRQQTVVETAVTSPPTKKQKVSKKEKKNKKSAKSKRETEEHQPEAVATFDGQKWNDMLQEYDIGEDGVLPVRMCAHGTMMQPVKHDENDPHSCDICDDGVPMNWDMFYVCHCDGLTTDWCYDHTRPVEFAASQSWRKVDDELKQLDEEQVTAIKGKYQRLLKILKKSERKRHHHKTKRNGDCLDEVEVVGAKFKHEDEREVEVHRGRKLKKKKKKKKKRDDDNNHEVQVEAPRHDANAPPISTSGLLQPQPFGAVAMPQFVASSINPFSANYDAMFKSMPMIEVKRDQLDINKINDSINLVTNGQPPSNALHHQPITEPPKFDFSQFPQNLAPTTTNTNIGTRSPALFAPRTVSNGGTSTTHLNSNNASTLSSNEKPPQPPSHQPPFGASLGQIINAPPYNNMLLPLSANHNNHNTSNSQHSTDGNSHSNDIMMHIPVPTQTSTQPPLAAMNQTPASSASSPFAATPDIIHKNQSASNSVQSMDRIQTLISAANHVESSQPQQQQNHSINATISPQAFAPSFQPMPIVDPHHNAVQHPAINPTQTHPHVVNHSNNAEAVQVHKNSIWGATTWDSSASTSHHTTNSNSGAHSPKGTQTVTDPAQHHEAANNADSNNDSSNNNHNVNEKNHEQHRAALPMPAHGVPVHPYMYPAAFQPVQLHPVSGPNGTHMYYPIYPYLMPTHYPHVQPPAQPPIATNKPVAVQR